MILPIEHHLFRDGTLFEEIEITESKIEPTVGNEDWHVRITFRVEEDLIGSCGFGLIFVLGALSFHDADQFTAADMRRHLSFEHGKLHMYVDYLRGRCVKTSVDVTSDGHVLLETVNRGQAATRWVDRLKGKKFLRPVEA